MCHDLFLLFLGHMRPFSPTTKKQHLFDVVLHSTYATERILSGLYQSVSFSFLHRDHSKVICSDKFLLQNIQNASEQI